MTRYGMVIDLNKCIGCGACVSACITENRGLQADEAVKKGLESVQQLWLRTHVEEFEVGSYPETRILFMHHICQHCENAPCVMVCPTGASYKTRDGVVLVQDDKCIGCEYCVLACPYDARILDPVTKLIDKCTFCYHRIAAGELPACVETCPAHARVFGDLDDPRSEVSQIAEAGSMVRIGENYGLNSKVFYVPPKQFTQAEVEALAEKPMRFSTPIITAGRSILHGLGWVGAGLVTAVSVAMLVSNRVSRRKKEVVEK